MGVVGYLVLGGVLLLLLALLGRRAASQALLERRSRLTQTRQIGEVETQAAYLMHQGKNDEAKVVLQRGIELARKFNQDEHELRFLHNLGTVQANMGEYGEAKEIFRHVSTRLKQGKGDEQFQKLAQSNFERCEREFFTAEAEASLAVANSELQAGRNENAHNKFEEAVASAKRSDNPVLVARVLNDYALLYAAEKLYDKAVLQLETALEKAKKHCPTGDPLLALIQSNIELFRGQKSGDVAGNTRGAVSRKEVAAPARISPVAARPDAAQPVVDTREAERKINALFQKGDERYRQLQHEEAADIYSEALALCESDLKNDHPFTASACNRLGMARMSSGFFGHARDLFDRAEVIMSEWPDRDAGLHESIKMNQAKLREEMGF